MDTKWKKGKPKSGGRKKGSKNKATVLFSDMLNEKTKGELLEVAIKMAKGGNATIMNKLLDKFMPSLTSIESTDKTPAKDKVLKIEFV